MKRRVTDLGPLLAPSAFSAGNLAPGRALVGLGAGLEAGFASRFMPLGLLPPLRAAKDGHRAIRADTVLTRRLLLHFLVE